MEEVESLERIHPDKKQRATATSQSKETRDGQQTCGQRFLI